MIGKYASVTKVDGAVRDLLEPLGVNFYKRSDDRDILERRILPYFIGKQQFKRVLFVGCDWYTRGYNKRFRGHEYWTLDNDPAKRKYGAAGRHLVTGIQHLSRHFKAESLDVIFFNGVFGWGLNAKPDVEQAFSNCYDCLRPGGVFVLGWNDVPENRPFRLQESSSLKLFKPWLFPPLSAAEYLTANPNKHTYSFFTR